MRFFYAPGACSLGIHFLLEEIGVEYEAVPIIIKEGEQFRPDYVRINPKSKVPALERDDGSILTEFGAISHWLANSVGAEEFKSQDLEEEVRTKEILDYVVGTAHMQGYSRILRPQKYTPNEADLEWVREKGREIVFSSLDILSKKLGDNPFIMGDRLSIADAAMLYTLFWAIHRLSLDVPPNVTDLYKRLCDRPAAQNAFRQEGLAQLGSSLAPPYDSATPLAGL